VEGHPRTLSGPSPDPTRDQGSWSHDQLGRCTATMPQGADLPIWISVGTRGYPSLAMVNGMLMAR
jgi:hypothetical protein